MIPQQSDLISIIIFLGLVQGIFLSILFISKKEILPKLIGIIIGLMSIMLLDYYAAYTRLSITYPHFIDISVPIGLLFGPIVFIAYLKSLENRFPKRLWLHFVPFLLLFINQLFYYTQSANFKYNAFVKSRNLDFSLKEVTSYWPRDPLGIMHLTGVFMAVSALFYFCLIIKTMYQFYQAKKLNLWQANDPILNWLKKIMGFMSILVVFQVWNTFVLGNDPNQEYILAIFLTTIIYFFSYSTISNSTLLNNSGIHLKYQKTNLPDELRQQLKTKLIQHMEIDQPYLSNVCSMKKLAQNLSTSVNYLSQVLNQDFQQNYHEFIATYRVEAARKYLLNPDFAHKNIEEISFMVGYNSKAAFNKAFKKLIGKTPLQFKKDHLN